ncbi:MAG: tetratricopeptide repeat protein [Desulfurobacteriaceae bacterium]
MGKFFVFLFVTLSLINAYGDTKETDYFSGGMKAYKNNNYKKALEFFKKAYDIGNSKGCYELGAMYQNGEGVGKNYQKAIEFYSKACELGEGKGCTNLGYMYDFGLGVKEDDQKAAELYSKGCKLGDGLGCYNSGVMYQNGKGVGKNYQKAVELYSRACKLGKGGGCTNLGYMYEDGLGVEKNYQKAIELYSKGCRLGNGLGCNNLGVMYAKGKGVIKDDREAVKLYLKACSLGNALGCSNLAYRFYNGQTVERDFETAIFLWERACELGYKVSCQKVKEVENELKKRPSFFGLKVGFTTEEEFKKIVKDKGWKIEKAGHRIVKDDISNPNVTGYVVSGIPLEKISSAYFWFFKGKLMKIEYRLSESKDKSTFYTYYDLLRNKYGNPDSYTKPHLADGKAVWNIGGVEIKLFSPWVSEITYLTYTDLYLSSLADKSDREIYKEETKKEAKPLEGI